MGNREVKPFVMDDKEKREQVNIREKFKQQLRPIDYYKELNNLDFNSLGVGDRFYLQDFGIYNSELTDDEFMLRLRFPAGRISNQNLLDIAKIVTEYNLFIILTARAGIQLHGLEEHNVLEAYKKLAEKGINTWQSFGDNIRNIATDVFDGIGKYNIIETYPIIKQMQDYILKNPTYVGLLPRRISTGISGSYANGGSFFASDLYFALAKKENVYGFNVFLGGKNTEIAQDANIFLEKEEVFNFFKAMIEAFNKHGLRKDRDRTRLFHLLEDIGIEQFKEYIKDEYKKSWEEKGELLLEKVVFNEFEELKDGKYSFCYHSNFARLESDELLTIANFSINNNLEVRLGIDQQLYILGLDKKDIPFKHINKNRTIIACAGSEFCPFSYWNIKEETRFLPLEKIEKNKILIGFSGCLKGCAKHEHSDIGLVGLRSINDGKVQKTARIYLGAEYTFGKATARLIFQNVPLNNLKGLLELIIEEFEESSYDDFEMFSKNILNNFSTSFLALWFLLKLKTNKKVYLVIKDEKVQLEEHFQSFLDNNFTNENFEDIINKIINTL